MRRIVVLCLLSAVSTAASARPMFGGGLGFETRIQREVNPEYAEAKSVPNAFAQMLFMNWGAHAEFSSENETSSSGALTVRSRTINLGAWARYKFLEEKRWRPFASLGVGLNRDRVNSQFGTATNESEGDRPYFGAGGGISSILWNHLLVEAEVRANVVRERKEPMVSALLRVGFLF